MASQGQDTDSNTASSEWKTEGHPWVDKGLHVAAPTAVPTSRNTAATVNLAGAVVGFGPVNEDLRKPALGRVLLEAPPQPPSLKAVPENVALAMDLTGTEIQELMKQYAANDTAVEDGATTTQQTLRMLSSFPIANSTLIWNVQERYQARLEQYMQESVLPPLIALAALEEATVKMVKQRIAQEDAEQAARASNSGNSKNKFSSPHPPLYYSKAPNQYMTPPAAAPAPAVNGEVPTHLDPMKEHLSSTPAAWLSRIKLGCQQAYNEHATQLQQDQQLLQLYTQVDTSEVELSSGRRSSSRIARITTEQWEQTKPRQTRSSKQKEASGVEVYLKGRRIATFLQKLSEMEQKLSDDGEEEDEDDEAEEEEEDEEDIDLFNPYLQPAYRDVLKTLRKLRLEDIQNCIPHWCQETHSRTSHKVLRQQLDEEEMDNVLEVDVLPLDTLILGVEKMEEEDEEAEEAEEEGGKMEVNSAEAEHKSDDAKPDSEPSAAAPKETTAENSPGSVPSKVVKPAESATVASSDALPEANGTAPATDVKKEPEDSPDAQKNGNSSTAETKKEPESSPSSGGDKKMKTEASQAETSVKEAPSTSEQAVKKEGSLDIEMKTELVKDVLKAVKEEVAKTSNMTDNDENENEEDGVDEEARELPSESMILRWEIPDSVEKAPSKQQVHKFLQSQDNATFGRLAFSLRRKDAEVERLTRELIEKLPDEGELERQQQETLLRKEAERAFQTKKSWDKWRFEGIHGGHTVWPKWQDAVKKWQGKRNAKEAEEASNVGEATAPTDQLEADRAKALELAQKENEAAEEAAASGTAASRRTRRKGAASGGTVFYGQSSQLTARQLVELILRLCSEKSTAPTILHLQSIVAEDGTQDPIRRLRAALGKLVWRRNQLARLTPSTDWTDNQLVEALKERPLLQVAKLPPETDAAVSTEAPQGNGSAENGDDVEMKDASKEEFKQADDGDHTEEEEALLQYLRHLHRTELILRKVVLEHLTEIPIPIVATAADEKKDSNEGYDTKDFEEQSNVEWQTHGHEMIGKHIFRPRQMTNTNDLSQCEWFTIKAFVPSVQCESAPSEPPNVAGSNVKDSPLVDRRMRFRAAPFLEEEADTVEFDDEEYLVLTEAQAKAGVQAAVLEQVNIDREEEEEKVSIVDHPFAGSGLSAKITLYPIEKNSTTGQAQDPVHCTVVGHDSVLGSASVETVHRILVLPYIADEDPSPTALWATLDVSDDTEIRCTVGDDRPKTYRVQQSDFHPESQAFAECRKIVEFLENHAKAAPFLEPVDPIALNIPDYTKVVTHPMDVSTLAERLESGHYSNVPPKQTAGRSPVARMLNGTFRDDVELIFDNAMLFNPPKDWIHEDASTLKKAVLRKLDSIAQNADMKFRRSGRNQAKQSIYLDEDSDVDMYEYESDNDDDDDYGSSRRKRRRGKGPVRPKADDNSTRAMEHAMRLQKTVSETLGLRGPFANLPIENDASSFVHPPSWNCRRVKPGSRTNKADDPIQEEDIDESVAENKAKDKYEEEMEQLVELQRTIEETETTGLRRSTRAVVHDEGGSGRGKKSGKRADIEYFMLNLLEEKHIRASEELSRMPTPSTRQDVEYICERLHDSFYAQLHKDLAGSLEQAKLTTDEENGGEEKKSSAFGSFANGSFPPFLGRMTPVSLAKHGKFSWEIRAPFQIPAIRWVIRGLIQSGHIGELEPLEQESMSSGVIMANHVYYTDKSLQPFEVLDSKELARRRRANNEVVESSEDEVELSAYEQLRAERVARNKERLKALGLA